MTNDEVNLGDKADFFHTLNAFLHKQQRRDGQGGRNEDMGTDRKNQQIDRCLPR